MPRAPDLTVVQPADATPLERLVRDYLANCRAGGLSEKTIRFSYGYPLREVLLPWCANDGITSPAELDRRVLDRFSADLQEHGGKRGPLSKQSVWTYIKAVNRFLKWAADEGEAPVGAKARSPKLPQHLVDILTRDEVQRIEDATDNERDALVVRLLADTGIRVGELSGMRKGDIIARDRSYFVRVRGKGDRERLVPITPALHRRVVRYVEKVRPGEAPSDRLFLSRRRDRRTGDFAALTESGVQQLIRELGARAGLEKRVHPHLFRHSAATWMLQQGMDSLLVAQILGHNSLAMIHRVYSHLTPDDTYEALVKILASERRP